MKLRAILPIFLVFALAAPASELPETDRRNINIRHTDTHYEFHAPASLEAWKTRADTLRKQILSAAGLLPFPAKTPLNPQVFGKLERDGYSIEKVLLETYPGFFLGGNLYRPLGKTGPFPGVVSPHGHWSYGRLEHTDTGSIPARAINLARQGYVVFAYDMVGYNDTRQAPHGFETPQDNLWGIGLLGLQLWDSIRAVDFLASLSDVDPNRIGATGASGGGTQTFLLTAVDDRVKFSAPVNMISAIMQGGSPCENAANLRIDTFNVELAALAAPRPMFMVAATGDWTKNTPAEEYPAIREIYRLFDAESNLEMRQFDSPHNYHQGSREAVYTFFGKKILGDFETTHFTEKRIQLEQLSDMLALWDRKLPGNAVDLDGLRSYLRKQAEGQITALHPRDAASLDHAQATFRERLRYSLLADLPAADDIIAEQLEELPNGETFVIGRRDAGDRIPAVVLNPKKADPAASPVLLIHPEGTAWALSSGESRGTLVRDLLERGVTVAAIDAFQTGRAKASRNLEAAGRNAGRYFTTFNRTDSANRVQDILTAIAWLRGRTSAAEIQLVGMGEAGVWTYFARALAGDGVRLTADLNQFGADSDAAIEQHFFVPGLQKAGGFRAAASLLPTDPTVLYNISSSFPTEWTSDGFKAAGAEDKLRLQNEKMTDIELVNAIAPLPERKGRR